MSKCGLVEIDIQEAQLRAEEKAKICQKHGVLSLGDSRQGLKEYFAFLQERIRRG